MNQISNSKFNDYKEKLKPLPFFLLMTLAIVLFLGGLLFFMYSIIIVVALNSPMAFLIVFGASGICTGLGLLSLHGFFAYGKHCKNQKDETVEKNVKTEKSFKDYLTLQNIAILILLISAIFAIASAALGAMNREKWTKAASSYMERNGYYSNIEYRDYKYSSSDVNKIEINFSNKNAVVIFTDDASKQGFVVINGYEKYIGQFEIVKSGNTLIISEGAQPSLDGALEKFLFFMFSENKIEQQVKIYIPSNLKNSITIEGKYILAK